MSRRNKGRTKSYAFGLRAESCAAWIFRLRGYRILERRYKTHVGEVDLIMRKGEIIAFVEVKARTDLSTAIESVTPRMRNRVARAAMYYVSCNPELSALTMRFDVMAFVSLWRWQHLDNAWQAPT